MKLLLNLFVAIIMVVAAHAFSAKKITFKPYGEVHQDNGKGGKGPLGKEWTTKCDTLAQPGIGPAGAITDPSKKPSGPGSKIKRSVDVMADNRKKVSMLKDLLG
jgi:hypothetical protein